MLNKKEVINMKKCNLWHILLNRIFILFNLMKNYERPSKDENLVAVQIKAAVLPNKENIMIDEFIGYTKTKIKVEEVYKGTLTVGTIIEIHEPYYESYYRGKKSLIVHESYEPLIEGKTYTFLLTKNEEYITNHMDKEEVDEITLNKELKKEIVYYKEIYHKAS